MWLGRRLHEACTCIKSNVCGRGYSVGMTRGFARRSFDTLHAVANTSCTISPCTCDYEKSASLVNTHQVTPKQIVIMLPVFHPSFAQPLGTNAPPHRLEKRDARQTEVLRTMRTQIALVGLSSAIVSMVMGGLALLG